MNQQKLIEENINLVYFLIGKYYPNFTSDEDIVQCGMVGLCRAAQSWDESRSLFSTYASKCILYEIYAEFRRRKRHKNVLSLDYPVQGLDGEPDSFGDLIAGELDVDYVDVQPFVDKLNETEQEIFDLTYSGLTPSEIARKLGVSQTTIREHIRRLRILWRKHYGD